MTVSEAKRLIKQGGVDVNGKTVMDWKYLVKNHDKIKIGKKLFVEILL